MTRPQDPHSFRGDGTVCDLCLLGADARPHSTSAFVGDLRERARTFSASQRKKDAKSGAAMPDGSFPIENASDLANAIRLCGQAKDPAAARQHIMARAKVLGLMDKIPASWKSEKASLATVERPFVVDMSLLGGPTLLTAPARVITDPDQLPRELAQSFKKGNDQFLWVQGRYVEADRANENGAYWTQGDLEMGEPTVQFGPVNMLHQERHIIGAITDAKLIQPVREGATGEQLDRAHIATQSVIWKFLYGPEAAAIERASESGHLYLSMECQAERVVCESSPDGHRTGCGREYAWSDYLAKNDICDCVRERASQRRFVNPTFLGQAIVMPPAMPAWGAAEAQVMREAATALESHREIAATLPDNERMSLMAQVIAYGKGL